jgi:hypothetical protein
MPAKKKAEEAPRAEKVRPNGAGVRPVYEARMGRVRASVWANQTENGIRFSVSVSRSYKDAGGNWKTATSFGREDLPLLGEVVRRAWEWTYSDDAYRIWSGGGAQPEAAQAPADEPPADVPF